MKVLTVHLDDQLHAKVKAAAKRDHRTVSNFVSLFLAQGVTTFDPSFLSRGGNTRAPHRKAVKA